MTDTTKLLIDELLKNIEDFEQRIVALAKDIPEEKFWVRPFPFGNSMGNLIAHMTGNLNYYIGAQIANSGYVRDRNYEFDRNRSDTVEDILTAFNAAIGMFLGVVSKLDSNDLCKSYTAVGADNSPTQLSIILRCTMHLHHHIGQMIYLRKAINGEVDA